MSVIPADNGRSFCDDPGHYDMIRAGGFGLSGAHRTGKTTVVSHLGPRLGFPVVGSIAGNLAAEMNLDVSKMSWFDRVGYQSALLSRFASFYAASESFFVADRTPLDLACYLLMDLPQKNSKSVMSFVSSYVESCIRLTNDNFLSVGVIQPGIDYVEEPGKPVFDSARQEKYNTLCLGLMMDDRLNVDRFILPRYMTGLEERVELCSSNITAVLEAANGSWETLPRC